MSKPLSLRIKNLYETQHIAFCFFVNFRVFFLENNNVKKPLARSMRFVTDIKIYTERVNIDKLLCKDIFINSIKYSESLIENLDHLYTYFEINNHQVWLKRTYIAQNSVSPHHHRINILVFNYISF